MKQITVALLTALATISIPSLSFAQTVITETVAIKIKIAQLQIVYTPSSTNNPVNCHAPAGTIVAALSTTGGDGSPVTFTATGGDTADFTIPTGNGNNTVVVGPSGVNPAHCGTTQGLTITATQQ